MPTTPESITLGKWVAHSPYDDKTWRGWEKCSGGIGHSTLVFDEKKACEEYIACCKMGDYFIPVQVLITVPFVRKPCTVVTQESLAEALAEAPRCPECHDTGVIETGNNDLPCSCPKGDSALFNTVHGMQTGAQMRKTFRDS